MTKTIDHAKNRNHMKRAKTKNHIIAINKQGMSLH